MCFYLDQKDLDLPHTCKIDFPNVDDLLNFFVDISPDDGYYKGGRFTFKVVVRHELKFRGCPDSVNFLQRYNF